MCKQVFISYQHESAEHAARVYRLGELLREVGLKVALDQFLVNDRPGGPDEGWPKWCADTAKNSACVLVIASTGWFAASDGTPAHEKTASLGAAWEANALRNYLYAHPGRNSRIRLVFLDGFDWRKVPDELAGWHQFRPFAPDGAINTGQFNQLSKWVRECLGISDIDIPEPPTGDPGRDVRSRVKPRFAHLWDLLLRHRKTVVAAMVLAAVAVVIEEYGNRPSPSPDEIAALRDKIEQAVRANKLNDALEALRYLPKGEARNDECNHILNGFEAKDAMRAGPLCLFGH